MFLSIPGRDAPAATGHKLHPPWPLHGQGAVPGKALHEAGVALAYPNPHSNTIFVQNR